MLRAQPPDPPLAHLVACSLELVGDEPIPELGVVLVHVSDDIESPVRSTQPDHLLLFGGGQTVLYAVVDVGLADPASHGLFGDPEVDSEFGDT